ncbi:O-antigen ligase family protein [Candidatus Thioglobus autotrophicus]|uniref:O-antigen ligase family protein n=1 Tax=Candidatus Thioglobus autotrophicus TaxID=1705394 RepID=UPI00299E952B|nr:O-antigen ligase family protein [Candidatus Thioglobus autotrophicus]WPE16250.1 O-antigen ligase family protein [Candidatus Thioglobus autotrophicus]
MQKFSNSIDNINSYLLILTAFFLPLTVFGGNFFAILIFLLWIVKADFKSDFQRLKNNKLVVAVFLYLLVHVIALLWTADIESGLWTLKKQLKFLFIPIFMLFVKREHIKYYILAFLASMSLSEIWSYGIFFELLPLYGGATLIDPIPLMSHITYNPFLAIAIYLLSYYVLFDHSLGRFKKTTYSFFIITMSINMFITGGRAGQVMYFAMLVILIFQYFPKNAFKAFLISSIVVMATYSTFYVNSKIFSDRVDVAMTELSNYKNHMHSSTGMRISSAINSWSIIKENPIIGVGTGDYKNEFIKASIKNNLKLEDKLVIHNPHNMYVLILVQFGLLGLVAMLYMFYTQIKIAINSNEKFVKKIGVALPLLYLLIMLSDSYLMVHMTGLLFIFISSFVYKDYESDKQYRLKTAK